MKPLPGFRDFYPEPLPTADAASADVRQHILKTWRAVSRRYGFREYDGPPLESLDLYRAKSGDEIVGQLYNFIDKGGREVALRPEMTPTLARMVAAHERQYKKPIKWFAMPQLFRYERKQKGRLREHFQFNADVIGESDRAADAELIALMIDTLRALRLSAEDFVVRLSSREAWQAFLGRHCPDPERAYEFCQVIDKLEREAPDASDARLREFGSSLDEVRAFIAAGEPTPELVSILGNLEARGMASFVKVDYGVIRGLAYYTGPVFEAFDCKGEFRAIAGGGRYDNLVKLISGGAVDLPALGFGMGDVVLAELLKARGLLPEFRSGADAYVLIEEESLRPASLRLIQSLRDQGFAVEYSLTPMKSDKQYRRALDAGVCCTIRLEAQAEPWLVRVKNLRTRAETVVPADDVAGPIRAAGG